MPRYMIERRYAERVELDKEGADQIRRVNDEEGIKWLFSFLSADKLKSYCLYEATNMDAIRAAAKRLSIPADSIVEVGGELRPEMFA
jgi:hypothetical protein